MSDAESVTHERREQQETDKGGKRKAVTKKRTSETSSRTQGGQVESRQSGDRQPDAAGSENQDLIVRIRDRAYLLFVAGGRQHGHDLEHWLEAERQITGSSTRSGR